MAKLGTITWTGKSNTSYTFNVYPIDEECPNEAGIYIFTKAVQNGKVINHTIIYIGKATSFEKRFYNHHKDDCIDKNGANRICLMQVKEESQRTKIELDLLDRYNTPCNTQNN